MDVRVGSKMGQIGPKWDKSRISARKYFVLKSDLKKLHNVPYLKLNKIKLTCKNQNKVIKISVFIKYSFKLLNISMNENK